ncbi:hypothetical protein BJA5080_06170 [Bradyrhizobium diazoefficiens SEMIA 5080]|uniref:Uncharacterized protein n=1 Tax=Bradyrhizobium diazoefficiens SEMIA 5080 TaxID=754504 RepID=A0A837C596_9BRAD|nr:hypothetical protein BJA5080_06170 [Bradyrhizobium diazoefficiens SEMIA 5080]
MRGARETRLARPLAGRSTHVALSLSWFSRPQTQLHMSQSRPAAASLEAVLGQVSEKKVIFAGPAVRMHPQPCLFARRESLGGRSKPVSPS